MVTTHEELAKMMDFDHIVRVHPDGTVSDRNEGEIWAPSLYDGELETTKPWKLMTGYTGQFGYNGPIMHESEFIGGRLADDILSEPGLYVVLASYICTDEYDEEDIDGWAIARILDEDVLA